MRKSWSSILLAALIAQIPFELRYEVLGLSNLQWTFVVLVIVTAPLLIENWKWIIRRRAVQAAGVFLIIQWLTAIFAPEFHTNAAKAAVRYTAGVLLLVIAAVKSFDQRHPLAQEGSLFRPTWVTAATIAAVYALLAYAGLGMPWLFRTEEFYIGQVQRLSGSFEYPNTAAAYFAMSLPIVWWSGLRPWVKGIIAFLLWCAVVLTFSRGALLAIPAAITVFVVFGSSSATKWRSAGVSSCSMVWSTCF
jgi:hypothetical protein